MKSLDFRLEFIGNAIRSARAYGVFGTMRLAAFEAFYESKFRSGTSRMVNRKDLGVEEKIWRPGRPYLPSPYYIARRSFRAAGKSCSGQTFVDVGSGLGRMLFFASQFPFRRLIGIEASRQLCEEAEDALGTYYRRRGKSGPPYEIVCCDAREFPVPEGDAIFFFCDPFDDSVLEPVLRRIVDTRAAANEGVTAIYVHPAYADVFSRLGFETVAQEVNDHGRGFMVFRRRAESLSSDPTTGATTISDQTNNSAEPAGIDPAPPSYQEDWDAYWTAESYRGQDVYDLIAAFYRRFIIRPAVNHFLGNAFPPGAAVLHAGCGSGAVDVDMAERLRITALDISPAALRLYEGLHAAGTELVEGSLFDVPIPDASFDGLFNLGVMEHFTIDEIRIILSEFHRVLRPGGRIVLFWPPAWGLSVNVLKSVHWVLSTVFRSDVRLHPPEHTHIRSRGETSDWLEKAGFEMKRFYFGPRDFFTHQIIVAEKTGIIEQSAK